MRKGTGTGLARRGKAAGGVDGAGAAPKKVGPLPRSGSSGPPMGPATWREFWRTEERVFRPRNWQANMEIFLSASAGVFPLGPRDDLLDIGCGPGYLEDALRGKVGSVVGLDVSENYIRRCRSRFAGEKSMRFHLLGENAWDYSFLRGQVFDRILCLSVVQYFRDAAEVQKLLSALKPLTRRGSLCLIADLCPAGGGIRSLFHSLRGALRQGWLLEQAAFFARLCFSGYREAYARQGLLRFAPEELNRLAVWVRQSLEAEATLLTLPLTLSQDRVHLLIEF